MDFKISQDVPPAKDYVSLRLRSGMGNKDLKRSEIALKNSLYITAIYDKNKLIGFGRIVGDGGITYVVSDIMVDKEYQRRGLADLIMKHIDDYFEKNTFEDSYIFLIANSPANLLYKKYKFDYLGENRHGMIRNET